MSNHMPHETPSPPTDAVRLVNAVNRRILAYRRMGIKTVLFLLDADEYRRYGELHPDGLPGLCHKSGFHVASRIVELDPEVPVMPETAMEYVAGILAVAERPVLIEYSEAVRRTGCISKCFDQGALGFIPLPGGRASFPSDDVRAG